MKRSTWKWLLLNGAGVVLYLVGVLIFIFTAISVYLGSPANSFENFSSAHFAVMMVSLGLLVAGRIVVWKFGGRREGSIGSAWSPVSRAPEKTPLEELGYQVPPEETNHGGAGFTYEDGEIYIVCEECGANNDPEFTYCSECSAKLPEYTD